jgi:tight adherence protein B
MTLPLALVFGLLVSFVVVLAFVGLWQFYRSQDPIESRLRELGDARNETPAGDVAEETGLQQRPSWSGVSRLLRGFGFGPRLAAALAQADVAMTATEFALIMVGAAVAGFVIGAFRAGALIGLGIGAMCGYAPFLYLRFRANRRRRTITEQLPDVLTLLVGGLRAGYGLSQALEMVVEELPPPISTEFARVTRAVGLGLPIQQALSDLSERIDSDDLNLVVTAIMVQYEMGGNLAQTLETIGDTVRDRIRMLREIRVMTAQQRLTGYLLAGLPIVTGILLFLIAPGYMRRLLEPGMVRLMPVVAVVLQVIGFVVIRRIVDIEV